MITLDRVLELFNELNTYPRESGNRKPVADYLCNFAQEKGLEYYRDEYENVVIKKEASKGMENSPSLILQAHYDMVCVKDEDVDHDFSKDPITSYIEDGWLKARGTTLGADNGIGVAIMLAFLESDTITPYLECVFTSDEETNMEGAKYLDKSILKSRYMINLDEETEDSITVSSAGISDIRLNYSKNDILEEYVNETKTVVEINIDGLKGGHSGIDIKYNRVNAIKLVCDLLYWLSPFNVEVLDIKAGTHMNAIPKDACVILSVENDTYDNFRKFIDKYTREKQLKYKEAEPGFTLVMQESDRIFDKKLKDSFVTSLIKMVSELPCGALAFEREIKDVVETSANIGRIVSEYDILSVWVSVRSSVDEKLDSLVETITVTGKKYESEVKVGFHEYGWPVNKDSKLVPYLLKIKEERKEKLPKVVGIHAGLECGTFSREIENADICAIGPNIMNPHTTSEKVEVKSIENFVGFLETVINRFDEIGRH